MKFFPFFLLLFPLCAHAEFDEILYEKKLQDQSWKEESIKLPAAPKDENLVKIFIGGNNANEYLVDTSSISVGRDGVVRYVVVIRSPAGARNVSFEGVRCNYRESRFYAFGRNDGSWSLSRQVEWRDISRTSPNRYQNVLHDDFFCPGMKIVNDENEAIQALKQGFHPRVRR